LSTLFSSCSSRFGAGRTMRRARPAGKRVPGARPREGPLDVDPQQGVMACGTWTGKNVEFTPATVDVTFGVVKQVDVVCGPDAKEM
jgi:hypothetical protein